MRTPNWIRRIFGLSVTDEKAWNPSLWQLYGSQSLSGETVTEHTALTYSAVWCAVNLISGTIATLPLHLMQRKGERKRIADDRPLYRVLHDEANSYMTAKQFRETILSHVLLWGNGYAEISRNEYGDVVSLWPITPNRVRPQMIDSNVYFAISMPDGQDVVLPRDKVLHIAGLGFDGFLGYSPIAMARRSIGLSMAMETFGSRYFGAGTHPGVVVSHPGKLGPEAHRNLKDSLSAGYSGLGKSHRLLLLEEGMKLEKLGVPPNDSQFLESRQFQVTDVARWFNLPPHKIKDLTRSSFSNIEQEQLSFVQDSLLPWLVTLEQAYNQQLLTSYDKSLSGRGRYYTKHVVEGLLRGDSQSRAQYYTAMLTQGVMSINEVRALEDMDPVEGGDIHLVPLNMTTLDRAGEPPEPTTPEPQQPEQQDPSQDENTDNEEQQ